MRNKLILILVLMLSACASNPVISTVVQKVEVPVAIPCKAQVPTKPEFSFDSLSEDKDIFEKIKALLADRKLHLGYETELSAALDSCVK